MSSNKFVGYLVSVECKNVFYQGIVTKIDSSKALIQLKNCFQNGLHCGNKLIDIKTTDIDNIEILADPPNAINLLKPKTLNEYNVDVKENTNLADVGKQPGATNTKENKTNNSSSVTGHNGNSNGFSNVLLNKLQNSNHEPKEDSFTKSNKTSNSLKNNANINNNGYSNVSPPNNNENYTNSKRINGHSHNFDNNDSCFYSISSESLKDDFDFEKNLALFDKNAFYEEVEGHSKPTPTNTTSANIISGINYNDDTSSLNAYDTIIKQLNIEKAAKNSSNSISNQSQTQVYHQISLANLFSANSTNSTNNSKNGNPTHNSNNNGNHQGNKNYRFDEMILDTGEPVDMQQIKVQSNSVNVKTYCTDDGYLVPSIDASLRQRLFEQAYKNGFNKQRQIECMGRCCTEMVLQLVGGPIRFSPKNNHQKPSILVLCNSNDLQGSYALCTARLLAIRSVKIYLFIYDKDTSLSASKLNLINSLDDSNNVAHFQNEFKLFTSNDQSNYEILKDVNEILNVKSIDLIINGLDTMNHVSLKSQQWYQSLVKYVNESCKASVLSVDPSKEGGSIRSKWCIIPVLPMNMSKNCGRPFLCDLGFTKNIFQSVNIKYKSPFGAKFVIPLHDD